MAEIKILQLREHGDIGMMQMIAERQARPGEHMEPVVATVLHDLSQQLEEIAVAYRAARFDEVVKVARVAAVTASSLRLDRLARVARTVCVLATSDDSAALAANVARMIRLGEDAFVMALNGPMHDL